MVELVWLFVGILFGAFATYLYMSERYLRRIDQKMDELDIQWSMLAREVNGHVPFCSISGGKK